MKIHRIQQGTDAWRECRRQIPTASNFAKIITASSAKASSQIGGYINKLIAQAFVPDLEDAFRGNRHTERGKELEPDACEDFARRIATPRGWTLEEVGFVTTDDLTAGCSPDRLIVGPDGKYIGGLEVKVPLPETHVGYVLGGGLPDDYKQQVHGSIVITGLPWHFYSYCPEMEPLHVVVEPTAYTRAMAEALREFTALYTQAWHLAEPKLTLKQ